MINLVLITLIALLWFFISSTIFLRKYSLKYGKSIKGEVKIFLTKDYYSYLFFAKKDRELTYWIVQLWISFLLFILSILISYFGELIFSVR